MEPLTPDTQFASSILEVARERVVARLGRYAALSEMVERSKLVAKPGVKHGIRAVPPEEGMGHGTIEFDPGYILQLSREHRHPEWVVCACLERLVLDEIERWCPDEAEQRELAAHRELRRTRSGIRSPD
jgi:hypothetical protein